MFGHSICLVVNNKSKLFTPLTPGLPNYEELTEPSLIDSVFYMEGDLTLGSPKSNFIFDNLDHGLFCKSLVDP